MEWFRILLLMSLSFAQEIMQYPENRTVYLGKTAVFTCVVTGGEAHGWRVNGTAPTNLPPEIQNDIKHPSVPEDGITHLTLELLARAEYNGTKVQCLTVNIGGGLDVSGNVTLLIQGLLSAVGNLTASYSNSSVTVNWTAPFSLDVTGVDHDIWYSVIIYNVTDENNPTVMDCTDCINITDTHYTFTPNSPGLCQSFNFSIIPINGAGEGESSHIIGYSLNGSELGEPHLKVLSDDKCQATFEMGHIPNACIVTITPATNDPEVNCSSNVCVLQLNEYHTFNIAISNTAGGMASLNINFTTFDVQDLTTRSGKNIIFMTVVFMENTMAMGCFIVLQQCHVGGIDDFRVILRLENVIMVSTIITNLRPSSYILFVHDLENNGALQEYTALRGDDIIVSGNKLFSIFTSSILNNATIDTNESSIVISCYFKTGVSEQSSCVLVYRQCNSTTITVKEYHKINTSFPTSVDIDDPQLYTFAIFGKDGTSYDEMPLITTRIQETTSTTTTTMTTKTTTAKTISMPQTVPPSVTDPIGKTIIISLGIATSLLVMVSCISIVILLVMAVKYQKKKSKKGDGGVGAVSRAAVYEEVDLPVTNNSSSVIETTPNTAYATTRFTVIDTHSNTACSTNSTLM